METGMIALSAVLVKHSPLPAPTPTHRLQHVKLCGALWLLRMRKMCSWVCVAFKAYVSDHVA